jgi:hypothetical protein
METGQHQRAEEEKARREDLKRRLEKLEEEESRKEEEEENQRYAVARLEAEDARIILNLVRGSRQSEPITASTEAEAAARVQRVLSEVKALERMKWRALVTLRISEVELLIKRCGEDFLVTPATQAEYWRQFEELKAEMDTLYGHGDEYRSLGDKPATEAEGVLPNALTMAPRLLRRLFHRIQDADRLVMRE